MNPLAHLQPELDAGLARMGIEDPALSSRLLDYLALLDRWNHAYNLTAIRDPREMLSKHLLDALTVLPHVASGERLADIGTGPGIPGIPLALALPGLEVTLVESNGKKCRFMREAKRQLGLGNVRVAESRAETLAEPGAYHCLVSRAFGTLAEFIRVGAHLLQPGGRLLAMKGQHPADEIDALPPGWRVASVHPLAVPGLAAERHLVVLQNDAAGSRAEIP